MTPTLNVVVGLGSNLGDRLAHLRAAAATLERAFEVRAWSALYETAPVGPAQPDYLNAAMRLRANVGAEALLESLLEIERQGGRVRSAETRWGARTIDLDILWIEGLVVATAALTVPHAQLLVRAFALRPLLDVAPTAIDPRTGARFVAPPADPGLRRTSLSLQAEPA